MATVFISYSWGDGDKELAKKIQLRLESKGHNVNIDTDLLDAGGSALRDKIHNALRESDGVVALLTKMSLQSHYVLGEVGEARVGWHEERKFLIPAAVAHMDIPKFVRDLTVVRMLDGSDGAADEAAERIHKGITAHVEEKENQNEKYPLIFISHRHKDSEVAKALASLLEVAFEIKADDIRCTSVDPYGLELGDRTSDRLKTEIGHAEVVLGIISPDTVESSYVLFELGASWGHGRPTFPLLVGGASFENVPSPLTELHSASLEDVANCQKLIDNLAKSTSLEERQGFSPRVAKEIGKMAKAARPSRKKNKKKDSKPRSKKKKKKKK